MSQTIECITADNTHTDASNEENPLEKTVKDAANSNGKEQSIEKYSMASVFTVGYLTMFNCIASGFYRGSNGLPLVPLTFKDFSVSDICEYSIAIIATSACLLGASKAKNSNDVIQQINAIPIALAVGMASHLVGYGLGKS